jgi:hypothetical protein
VLSRLISLLSRIPAVKWAFNRLRPLPHSGSIDAAPIAADEQSIAIAQAAPALDTDISAEPLHRDGDIEAATPVAEDDTAASVIAESPSAALIEISGSDDSSLETPAEIEPVVVEEVSVSSVEVESEPVTAADPVTSGDASSDDDAEIAPVVAEQAFIAPVEMEAVPLETSEPVIEDEPASVASVEIEAVAVDETPAVMVDTEIAAPAVAASIDNEPAPGVVTEMEPVVASDPAAVVAEDTIADAPDVAEHVEPTPASPAPKSAPKLRARPVEPADRATLIRQRWAETGIRMWNPRLHGTGEATLNIQGRIGLLPPEPGETMPRYDKLEFEMLGGQIVCEGVIVEAPAHAGQRSFTRLAEPRGADRFREPVRERQAALA